MVLQEKLQLRNGRRKCSKMMNCAEEAEMRWSTHWAKVEGECVGSSSQRGSGSMAVLVQYCERAVAVAVHSSSSRRVVVEQCTALGAGPHSL